MQVVGRLAAQIATILQVSLISTASSLWPRLPSSFVSSMTSNICYNQESNKNISLFCCHLTIPSPVSYNAAAVSSEGKALTFLILLTWLHCKLPAHLDIDECLGRLPKALHIAFELLANNKDPPDPCETMLKKPTHCLSAMIWSWMEHEIYKRHIPWYTYQTEAQCCRARTSHCMLQIKRRET